jgi:MoaA/NifB/PqqE/SkfB family radical SAM enzyme
MNKIKVPFLDVPIIRSCNLECGGCLTFSDNKRVKGLVNIEESREWLEFWAARIDPAAVTVFGGEPLLHPQFVEWCRTLKSYWPNSELRINTNGYYLDKLADKIPELFNLDIVPQFIVSIQTGHEPYYSVVKQNVEKIKQLVHEYYAGLYPSDNYRWNLWLDEPEIHKHWWRLDFKESEETDIRITICEQFRIPWQAHYQGSAEQLRPFYDYDDVWFNDNHSSCQAKSFINLYKGKIYKCPTSAVLEHTLETFNLTTDQDWEKYLENYSPLTVDATDEQIAQWFKNQLAPEKICNMCGFSGPKYSSGHLNRHELKQGWKFDIVPLVTL